MKEYQVESCYILLVHIEHETSNKFTRALEAESEMINTFSCYKYESAFKYLKAEEVDVVVVDPFPVGDRFGQSKFISKIKELNPDIKVLVVSDMYDEDIIIQTFRQGASGYILYQSGIQEFPRAVMEVLRGGAPMSREVASCLVTSYQVCHQTPLTPRERDVLREISSGKSYRYIAQELNVAVDTIRTHAQHIFEKLEVHNKSEAVIKAKLQKLV